MFDVVYYIILSFLIPLGLRCNKKASILKLGGIEWNVALLFLFIATVLLRGLAYDTGQDYMFYYDYYQNTVNGIPDAWGEHTEVIYKLLVDFLILFSNSPTLFFVFSSIIVIGTMLKVSQNYGKSASWIMILWWTFMHTLSFNLYRQYYAISFILLAYLLWTEKKYKWSLVYITLSIAFHTSSFLMIMVIFVTIYCSKWQYNKWLPICAVVLTTFFSTVFNNQISVLCDMVSLYYQSITGQLYEASEILDSKWETSSMLYPNMIVYIIWLWYGYKYCKENPQHKSLYNIFALTLILIPITRQEILMRLCLYLTAFCPIFLGLLMTSRYRKEPLLVGTVFFHFAYYIYGLSSLLKEFPLRFDI